MNQNKFLKIFAFFAFAVLLGASCWATVESLHLLLPEWPIILFWAVAIIFFVAASLGSKLIVDSLSQRVFVDNKAWRFLGGVFLMIAFWICFSLPTNTHTFFYRSVINDKVTNDISTTRGYLGQIRNNTRHQDQAQIKINDLENQVEILLGELEAEIMNDANPGFGPTAKEILRKFANLLDAPEVAPLSHKGGAMSKQERIKLCDGYRKKIYLERDKRAAKIKQSIKTPIQENIQEADIADRNLAIAKDNIANKTLNLGDAKDAAEVCDKLNDGYTAIKKNANFVNFQSELDEAKYTAENPVTEVRRMLSVIDVWKDFFAGKYAGFGFIFWIIISALIDIAGFIFFDIAFKQEEF